MMFDTLLRSFLQISAADCAGACVFDDHAYLPFDVYGNFCDRINCFAVRTGVLTLNTLDELPRLHENLPELIAPMVGACVHPPE